MSRLVARDLWIRPPGLFAPGRPGRGRVAAPVETGTEGYAVRGASLTVEPAEWVALTGPNGGGKTSLLLVLAGLWPSARGDVHVDGDLLAPSSPRAVRARVATLLQDPSTQLLQPTVREELAFAGANLGLPTARIREEVIRWMSALDLEEWAETDPSRLSAGLQQLVLLAAALAHGPEVLVADEPGAHLDPPHRRQVLCVLDEERARGLAIVWATQNEEELRHADRVVRIGATEPGILDPAPSSYAGKASAPGQVPEPGSGSSSPIVLTPRPGGERRERRGNGSVVDETEPAAGEAALKLNVAPWDGRDGPHVRTPDGFRISIPARGIVAITGPNGIGKSVLLSAAAGVEIPAQVEVRWTRPPAHPPLLVSQYPERLFFEEVVRDEVLYAAGQRGAEAANTLREASRCFETLNLDASILSRRLWELSGGTRRLVELVAALIAPSDLLVLDEPTAGLDPRRRSTLAELVAARARGSAVLIATQDSKWMEEAGVEPIDVGRLHLSETPSLSKKTD